MGSCGCPVTTGASIHAIAPFPVAAHRTRRADLPHPACMGLFLSRGRGSTTFSFFLRFLGPFFCSTAPQVFFRPDRKIPKPTRAAAVKDGAFLQCRPKGPLSLTDVSTAACCDDRVRLD